MKTNQDYKNAALLALKGNWGPAVLLILAYFGINAVATAAAGAGESVGGSLFQLAVMICVLFPLAVGMCNAFRGLLHGERVNFVQGAFRVGFNNWKHNVGGMFLVGLYTFLWTLCLIVPGIIKGLAYSLTPFILAEKPELSANEAIELSMKMMDGRKMDLFILHLSFIGWYLLGILTLCIGYLWLMPYVYTSLAAFYEDAKADYESKQVAA